MRDYPAALLAAAVLRLNGDFDRSAALLAQAAPTAWAAVRANEPGNKLYQLTKPLEGENVYKVLEIYVDADAIQAHRDSAHFKELGAALGPFMAGRAELVRLAVELR